MRLRNYKLDSFKFPGLEFDFQIFKDKFFPTDYNTENIARPIANDRNDFKVVCVSTSSLTSKVNVQLYNYG